VAATTGSSVRYRVPHRFLRQPDAEHLVVGIADAKPKQHSVVAAFVEALGSYNRNLWIDHPFEGAAYLPR
jgi:hypothetical protein